MRKIVAIENVTLDGVADSQEGLGFEWTARGYDDEVDRYSNEHVRADVDTAMYGRATYLGMQGFWSKMLDNPDGTPTERAHAEWVNNVDKVVFSTTLESADWANSRLISGNVAEEVATLKAQPGGTMAIYASPKAGPRVRRPGLDRRVPHPRAPRDARRRDTALPRQGEA